MSRNVAMNGAGEIRASKLELAGVSTRALSVEGDGPAFLFLHGYTDSADTWRYVLTELGKRGRAAVAVDLPSHGHADTHADAPVLPQLKAFASALAERHPGSILAGNSLGGLAALLAAEDPALPVAGVVPIGPAGIGYERWFLALSLGRSGLVGADGQRGPDAPLPPGR